MTMNHHLLFKNSLLFLLLFFTLSTPVQAGTKKKSPLPDQPQSIQLISDFSPKEDYLRFISDSTDFKIRTLDLTNLSNPFPFTDLPEEIQHYIASFADTRTLVNLSQVNREIRYSILNSTPWRERFQEKKPNPHPIYQLSNVIGLHEDARIRFKITDDSLVRVASFAIHENYVLAGTQKGSLLLANLNQAQHKFFEQKKSNQSVSAIFPAVDNSGAATIHELRSTIEDGEGQNLSQYKLNIFNLKENQIKTFHWPIPELTPVFARVESVAPFRGTVMASLKDGRFYFYELFQNGNQMKMVLNPDFQSASAESGEFGFRVAYSFKTGQTVFTSSQGGLRSSIIHLNGTQTNLIKLNEPITSAQFSLDERWMILGHEKGRVQVVDATTHDLIASIDTNLEYISHSPLIYTALAPSKRRIIGVFENGSIEVWSADLD